MNPRIKMFCGGLSLHMDGYNMLEILITECNRLGLDVENVIHKHVFINPKPLHLTDDEVNTLYNAADVGMNTCRGEGFGLTTIEHLYFNRPQIVSGVPALRETLKEYAHVVEPKVIIHSLSNEREGGYHAICDYKDFADHLQICFKSADTVTGGREHVKQNYDWNKVLKNLDYFAAQ